MSPTTNINNSNHPNAPILLGLSCNLLGLLRYLLGQLCYSLWLLCYFLEILELFGLGFQGH